MIPAPSSIRVVRIAAAPSQFAANFNGAGRQILEWPAKHPLDADWWWVDATGWCQDIGDTLLAPPAKTITGADGALTCISTTISTDGLQAGFLLTGGTSALSYTVTARLIGRTTGVSWAGDLLLPMETVVPISAPSGNTATMNASVLRVGGTTLVPGQAA